MKKNLLICSISVFISLFCFGALILSTAGTVSAQSSVEQQLYLPLVTQEYSVAPRIGYNITTPPTGTADITEFPAAQELHGGWYLDWQVRVTPARPNNIEFAQLVRVHQRLSCGQRYHANRTKCPYVQPIDQQDSYNYWPSAAVITAAAQANPGSLWLIGNEMERRDWESCANPDCSETFHTGQDEILPVTYAVAYNELYHLIKEADPTAQVAIGGVIQATPLRLEYLTQIWDAYQEKFGTEMPVDVWNVHNFIFPEARDAFGADIPVGLPDTIGSYVGNNALHVDMDIFKQQIWDFREWMASIGEQNKPLIVSEYGVLMHNDAMNVPYVEPSDPNDPGDSEAERDPEEDEAAIHDFMLDTFDFFLNEKDCNIGYPADDCRLVQRWNWYSLDNRFANVNPYTTLINVETGELAPAGEKFREYVLDNWEELSLP